MAVRQSGCRNPHVVIIETESLAFERRLETAIGVGDWFDHGFDWESYQNALGAGFQIVALLARRQAAQTVADFADDYCTGHDGMGLIGDSGLDLGMVAHQVAYRVGIEESGRHQRPSWLPRSSPNNTGGAGARCPSAIRRSSSSTHSAGTWGAPS